MDGAVLNALHSKCTNSWVVSHFQQTQNAIKQILAGEIPTKYYQFSSMGRNDNSKHTVIKRECGTLNDASKYSRILMCLTYFILERSQLLGDFLQLEWQCIDVFPHQLTHLHSSITQWCISHLQFLYSRWYFQSTVNDTSSAILEIPWYQSVTVYLVINYVLWQLATMKYLRLILS